MSDGAANVEPWIDYDYAVVRVVPRVHIGVFVNIGIVLHSRTAGFLDTRFNVDVERLRRLDDRLDISVLDRFLDAYRRVGAGGAEAGMVGLLPPSERFHWLTAPKSAVLQTSAVHPGRCRDLEVVLDGLLREQCC